MRKTKLHLVTDSKIKKKYQKFLVFLCDESFFEYDLAEWQVYRDDDWIEVSKIDDTEMDAFLINNVMRVRFASHNKKSESVPDRPELKPVA